MTTIAIQKNENIFVVILTTLIRFFSMKKEEERLGLVLIKGNTFRFPKPHDVLAVKGRFCYSLRQSMDGRETTFVKCIVAPSKHGTQLVVTEGFDTKEKPGRVLTITAGSKLFPISFFGQQIHFCEVPMGTYVFYDGMLCKKTSTITGDRESLRDDRTRYGYVTELFTGKPLPVALKERVDVIDCDGGPEIIGKGLMSIRTQ